MTLVDYVLTLGALFLGWSLGRNNFSNLFGLAVGTRMVGMKKAAFLAGAFVFLGFFLWGNATMHHVNELARVSSSLDAFVVCVSAGVVIFLLSKVGIPASITQTGTGAMLAWNVFQHIQLNEAMIEKTFLSWVITPFLSGFMAFLLYRFFKFLLVRFPLPILERDILLRIGLILVGAFCSVALGANNIASIAGPYVSAHPDHAVLIGFLTCCSVALGFFMADKGVIKTVSKGMFPLSPMEAFIVVFSSAAALFCFSNQGLKDFLIMCHLPSFPLVPVPLAVAVIGSIVAIALSKGIDGLKFRVALGVVGSWFLAPTFAGLISFGLLFFVRVVGDILLCA